MTRPRARRIWLGLLLVALVGLVAVVRLGQPPPRQAPTVLPPDSQTSAARGEPARQAEWRLCERVIDGDTIVLDGDEHVRLIGVDTLEKNDVRPEVRRMARQAASLARALAGGRKVRLEYDQTRYDRYHRTLAYVYLEDGTLLNAEIVRRGYGFAYVRFPFRRMEEFRAYERAAREGGAGLWGTPAGQELKATGRRTSG